MGSRPIVMARLIFVNRYFFPDHSATSQILSDLTVAALPEREIISGVNVHRIASTRFGRATLLGRALDYSGREHPSTAVSCSLTRIA